MGLGRPDFGRRGHVFGRSGCEDVRSDRGTKTSTGDAQVLMEAVDLDAEGSFGWAESRIRTQL